VKRAELLKVFKEAVEAETYLEYNKKLEAIQVLFSIDCMKFQASNFYLRAQLDGVQMDLSHSADKASGKEIMNMEFQKNFPLAFEASKQNPNQPLQHQPNKQPNKSATNQIINQTNNQILRILRAGRLRSRSSLWRPLRSSLRPFRIVWCLFLQLSLPFFKVMFSGVQAEAAVLDGG
jgi:hypothetical protein